MRVITQNISQVAVDVDGITVLDTDVTGPFPLDLALDGAYSSVLPHNGVSVIDFARGQAGVHIGFSCGATGSIADVTIIGTDTFGNYQSEVVTMPGAAATVSSVKVYGGVTSLSIDGAYTNLSVGILNTDDQYTPWTPWDTMRSGAEYFVGVQLVSGTLVATESRLEHCVQTDFMLAGGEPDSTFTEAAPFATITVTAPNSVEGLLGGPVTASRVRIDGSSTAAVLRVKYLQSGNGTN